jgi:hypothetical protein
MEVTLRIVDLEDQRAGMTSIKLYASELPDIPKALVTGVQVGLGTAMGVWKGVAMDSLMYH